MSMYVRVKREKLTVFLHVDATDLVSLVKSKLQELLQKPAEDLRLYKEGSLLEDDKTLSEHRVENDDELAVVFRTQGDEFEAVRVERCDAGAKEEAAA